MRSLSGEAYNRGISLKQDTVTMPPLVDEMKKSIDLTCSLRSRLETPDGFYRWFTDLQFDLKALGLTNIAAIATEQETNLTDHHSYRLPDEKEEGYIREYIMNTVFLPDVITNNPDIPVVQTLYQVAQMCDYIADYPTLNEQLASIPVREFSKAVLLQNKCLDLLLKAKLSGMGLFDEKIILRTLVLIFPEPVKSFIFNLTDAEKSSLANFIEAYDKHLRFSPVISQAIIDSAPTVVKPVGLSAYIEENNIKKNIKQNSNGSSIHRNSNIHYNGNRSSTSHTTRLKLLRKKAPKFKGEKISKYWPCFNCGKYGHMIFQDKCPKYANIQRDLDHGVSKKDIMDKYRTSYNKHYNTNYISKRDLDNAADEQPY
ncbi:unnamed protein product [Ambrosiozyma monospora]|uniref:Unnamed protein product n=1 Tax=Ambrosiozyma monospora TaxID=43982 RepID=A0A9W6YT67_AMBMO|nr:unnamed protein product [Ambrosiozyma monospora]